MCAALNPYYPASFGLSGNAVAAVAAAAAAAVLGNNAANNVLPIVAPNNNPSISSNAATQPPAVPPNYHAEKIEWINRIENSHIDRVLMNKLIMNYLVNEGFKEAADKFHGETGIHYQYDAESLKERIKIRESIEIGNINDAIYLINHLQPELMDNNRLLAFHLRQQQLIELIREKRLEDALTFAQDHLCEYSENSESIQEELERTMALLAFETPNESPFSDLLKPLHRQKLASEVNSAILEFENLESNSKLNVLIKMLLWSQELLDKRSVPYPKMTDIANARIEEAVAINLSSNN